MIASGVGGQLDNVSCSCKHALGMPMLAYYVHMLDEPHLDIRSGLEIFINVI